MKTTTQQLTEAVGSALPWLTAIDANLAAQKPAPGKWSAKEIIGHLIDSAANNHQRFVRAQFGVTALQPYRYAQDQWVNVQQYQTADWPTLLALWRYYNLHLAHLIANLRQEYLDTVLDVWDEPATLRFVAEDYVRHLKHHLEQIRLTARTENKEL